MSGEIEIRPGYVFDEVSGEPITLEKLNKMLRDLIARVDAGAITARELADGSINADKLAFSLESQMSLADGSVTTAKIADDAVTGDQIADGAIGPEHLNFEIGGATGEIKIFPVSHAPTGYLECNGAEVAKADYADLYTFLCDGTGACIYGETPTHFTLPDARGRFVRGWDNGVGRDSGRTIGSVQDHALQGHKHTDSGHAHTIRRIWCILKSPEQPGWEYSDNGHGSVHSTANGKAKLGDPVENLNGAVNVAGETRPMNIAFMVCIKT